MIPPRSIETNAKPGGLVFLHFLDDNEVPELRQEIVHELVEVAATHARDRSVGWVASGHVVTVCIYDGDSGVLLSHAVADRSGRRRIS